MAIHTTPDSYTKLLIHSDTSNGSTTFVDSSPSGHTITATNANHTSSLAKFGDTSMHFDGDGDYLGVATSSDFQLGTGSFTLEAWVYLTVVDNHYNIFDTYSPGGTNGFLAEIWNDNTIAFYSEGGVDWQTPGGTELAVNTWYHLAWVRDGNNLRMFVNGVQQGSTVTLSASDNYTEGVLRIGGRPVDYHLSGYLDEIRISNVARWTDSFVPPNKPYSVVDDDFVTDVAGIEDDGSGNTTFGRDIIVKSNPDEASTDTIFSVQDKVGTPLLEVRADGIVTKPYQPAFHAQPTSAQSNITTGGVTIVYGTERFDQGNNFASNTFTAPVTGKYCFQVSINLRNLDTACDYYVTNLITSNKTYEFTFDPGMSTGEGDWNAWNWAFSVLADMDASDTAYVQLNQETGTAQSDINVNGTWFSGYLVC
jgi:hypothetical protein